MIELEHSLFGVKKGVLQYNNNGGVRIFLVGPDQILNLNCNCKKGWLSVIGGSVRSGVAELKLKPKTCSFSLRNSLLGVSAFELNFD